MNIDELKTIWKQYDEKLENSRKINDQLIVSVIRNRSNTRFETVKRNYRIGLVWMLFCLGIGVAVLMGNPFDYNHWMQYIPIGIYVVCLSIMIVHMARSYSALEKVTITPVNLSEALYEIISVYERPRRFVNAVIGIFLVSQIVLFNLSFVFKSLDKINTGQALLERLIPIAIAAGMFFLAKWLGAFKERNAPEFRNDLSELEQLKQIQRDLKAE